jgi:uncharacterized membrane protein
MARSNNLIGGVVIGAGLMYLLDPDRGRRRRTLVKDQMVHGWSGLDDVVDTAGRDLKNRMQGLVAETRSKFRGEDDVSDEVLTARVRSEIGRVVSHPHAIQVQSQDSHVTLSGPVLEAEKSALISAVKGVRGVDGVINNLEAHREAGTVPGLQGQPRRPGKRSEVMQENWAPAIRLLMGIGGGLTTLYGRQVRGPVGSMISLVGLGVLARAATNLRINRLTGVGAGRRAVEVQKSINVDAPVEEVFGFWSNFENLPRFMSRLRDVRRTSDDCLHFTAEGPAGTTVEWKAMITQFVPNDTIAWKSVKGAVVGNAGIIKFQPNEKGGTRVDIRLTYNPPGGAIGHAIASFFGFDPKSGMDRDMVRFKSLVEKGKTTAHGETVRREDLGAFPVGYEQEEGFGGEGFGRERTQH